MLALWIIMILITYLTTLAIITTIIRADYYGGGDSTIQEESEARVRRSDETNKGFPRAH
jgi:hypothetical protein